MIRVFKSIRNTIRKQPLAAFNLSNGYHYQNDIYTSKLEPENGVNESLRQEIFAANQLRVENPNLYRFIKAYHQSGFKLGKIDPLAQHKVNENALFELNPEFYGLKKGEPVSYKTDGLLHSSSNASMTLEEIENYLKVIYSSNMTIEFDFITNEEEKHWISKEFEKLQNQPVDNQVKVDLAKLLLKSQAFDHFMAMKFPTFKRYSLEGGESSMAFYHSMFYYSALSDIEELVMGIAHRGRLNLSVCMLDLDPALLFSKIKGKSEFSDDVQIATGDVAHHLPCSTNAEYAGKKIHLSLLNNPSHLEAVDPLVLGKARAKQMCANDCYYTEKPSSLSKKVSSFLIHGDGAFAGQGILTETFQLSRVPNYAVGGTVHLITNNQLGFTLPSSLGRSSNYNSDLAKAVGCPVIHVNGDYPELAHKAAEFAVKYRNTFGKDIVVDLVCFRKYGHNELDDPSFTNPLMYQTINQRQSVPNLYREKIVDAERLVDNETLEKELSEFRTGLDAALDKVLNNTYKIEPRNTYLKGKWSQMRLPSNKELTSWATGCSQDLLKFVGIKSVQYPKEFSIHANIERAHVKKRIEKINEASSIDWSTAEAVALGSLLLQGFKIRLSGQDVGRGTFSHRHALLVDQKTSKTYVPLNNIDQNQNNYLEVCNSILSEEAVLGFDYGFSIDDPRNLVIWEAQFGDFFNGAQIIIDTYVNSAEAKWLHQSGIVLLLPHGFDGAGPEHSSCRIERFLQMSSSKEDSVDSDAVNYFVAHPTTPANYFHLLRRQMLLPFRKPLIMASPKVLIRLPECVSSLSEMDVGTSFKPVIDDPNVKSRDAVKRVILVFGKHYYTLEAERARRKLDSVAIVRVEELSPFPTLQIRQTLSAYKNANEFVWSQEEHRNMGAWSFVEPRFEKILGVKLRYVGREVQACVSGIGSLHAKEAKQVVEKTFDKL